MTSIFVNIRQLFGTRDDSFQLYGKDLAILPGILNAYMVVEGDRIAEIGEMTNIPRGYLRSPGLMDVEHRMVLPCWCDSHSHIVYAGSRENEFIDKIRGLTYAEIAARGGGILHSAKLPKFCQ